MATQNFDGSPLPALDSAHSAEWLALVAAVEADLDGPEPLPELTEADLDAMLACQRHEARIMRRARRATAAARKEYRADRARRAFDRLPLDVQTFELDQMRRARQEARALRK